MVKKLRVLSLFDGCSCAMQALKDLGIEIEVYYASEIDPYAIKVSQKNHPEIIHLGDVNNIDSEMIKELGHIDLVIGGSPCFPAGTQVLTNLGYKNIEDVKVGDLVLTHKGNFKKVLRIGGKENAPLLSIDAMGTEGLRSTPEHPFYVRKLKKVWNNQIRRYERKFSAPEWVQAKDLDKSCYISQTYNTNIISDDKSNDFWEFIGRFTADGWLVKTKRKGRLNSFIYKVMLCCGKDEKDEVVNLLERLGYHYNITEERTVYKFCISNKELLDYLELINRGAKNKVVHPDVFHLAPEKIKSYLKGYFDGDGDTKKDGCQNTTSISRVLTLGTQYLVNKVFNTPCRFYKNKTKSTAIIEGRLVKQQTTYTARFKKDVRKQDKAFFEEGYVWLPVKEVQDSGVTAQVYNLEVEDDNSYTADNVIVHNCTDLSIAKRNGKGLEGQQSKLFFQYLRILKEVNPTYFVLENVASMKNVDKDIITGYMGVEPIMINSALLTAQQRKRYYWSNIQGITQPEDKGIYLRDILESGETDRLKSYCITATYSRAGNLTDYFEFKQRQIVFEKPERIGQIGKGGQGDRIYSVDGKSVSLSANGGGRGAKTGLYCVPGRIIGRKLNEEGKRDDHNPNIKAEQRLELNKTEKTNTITTVFKDNVVVNLEDYSVRKLTPIECERLQGLKDNYTEGVSNSQRYKMLGNGFTVNVISHILSFMEF